MTFTCDGCSEPVTLTAEINCKLFPTLMATTKQELLGEFIFTPETGCQPLSSLFVPTKIASADPSRSLLPPPPPPPPLLPAMKLSVLTWYSWRQLQEGRVTDSGPPPSPLMSPTSSLSSVAVGESLPANFFSRYLSSVSSVPISVPHYSPNMVLAATLPQKETVMWLSEIVEQPELKSFHLETLNTLQAICLHGNTEAAKQVTTFF